MENPLRFKQYILKRLIWLNLVFLFFSSFVQSETYAGDLKVVEFNESKLVIEYNPQWSLSENKWRLGLSDKGITKPGKPLIPKRVFPVLLKSSLSPKIQILTNLAEKISIAQLELSPSYDFQNQTFNKVKNSNSQFESYPLINISEPQKHKEAYLAYITISPLQKNRSESQVTKTNKLVFELQFSSKVSSGVGVFSKMKSLSETKTPPGFLNFGQFELWQQLGEVSKTKTSLKTQSITSSVLSSGKIYKLGFEEGGLYKCSKAFFDSAGIDLSSYDPRNFKLYFNGAQELSPELTAPVQEDLTEITIDVVGQEDGSFDDGDFIRFYVKGPSGVSFQVPKYPPRVDANGDTEPRLTHYQNRQSNFSYAFLKVEGERGKRLQTEASLNNPNPFVASGFKQLAFHEVDKINITSTGIDFFDRALNASLNSVSYQLSLPGILINELVNCRFKAVSTGRNEAIELSLNGVSAGTQTTGSSGASGYTYGEYFYFQGSALPGSASNDEVNVQIQFSPSSYSSQVYPDWVELTYSSGFEAKNNWLEFNSLVGLSASEIVEFNLTGFNETPTIWEISDLSAIKQVTPNTQAASSAIFQTTCFIDSCRKFIAFNSQTGFKKPHSIEQIQNQNLIGLTPAEYILVYPEGFEEPAQRLIAHRKRADLESGALSALAVNQTQIFNEFSGGKPDFTAIRNFVRFLYQSSTAESNQPKYLLLMGDGDWDMRGIVSEGESMVLCYQSDEILQPVTTVTTTDDFFGSIEGDVVPNQLIPEIAVGRLTAQTVEEAGNLVEKIISYETAQTQGLWRNRVIFVADDGPNGSDSDGAQFSNDSERIIPYLPNWIYPQKLYSAFYDIEITANGRRRPDAYQAIVDQINQGALITNFIGHGNPSVWTAERIFEPGSSLALLNNTSKLTIGVTATCDFGRADNPYSQSGAEQMLALENGGAVAMLTTTRSIFVSSGSSYPPLLFQELFRESENGGRLRLGEGYQAFKVQRGGAVDASKFTLLGDPALVLACGKLPVVLDSVNSLAISDSQSVQIKALEKVMMETVVQTQENQTNNAFQGNLSVEVYDTPSVQGADHEGTGEIDSYYSVQKSLVFKGSATVSDGKSQVRFIVPKNIKYDSTQFGKTLLYAWSNGEGASNTQTASGANEQLQIYGTFPTTEIDEEGPQVEIFLDDESFRSGGITGTDPLFLANLSDQNGINLATGSGQEILLVLDENEKEPLELNSYYEALENSFSEGRIEYPLQNLSSGRHSLKFKVWDNFNNSTEQYLYFTVEENEELAVGDVYNYPNPFNPQKDHYTWFVFPHNRSGEDLEVEISIYTVAGRKIKVLKENFYNATSRIKMKWDGRDDVNDAIANGVYIYKVRVKSLSGDFQKKKLQKLVIFR